MKTYVHCKIEGVYRVFALEEYWDYDFIMDLMKLEEVQADGAIMLTYSKN